MNRAESPIAFRLFCVIFLFTVGTALFFNIGSAAGRDSWIAILTATVPGALLTAGYLGLFGVQGRNDLYQLLRKAFGRVAGSATGYLYVIYFLYIGSRDVRDLSELINNAILIETPSLIVALSFVALLAYIVWNGMGNLPRMSVIFFGLFAMGFVATVCLFFMSGKYDWSNIRPVLGDGVGPVLKPVFLQIIEFPFGETIVLMTVPGIFNGKIGKTGVWTAMGAALAGGMVLSIASIMEIVTMGVPVLSRATFPFLSSARNVSFGFFIERIEIIAVFIFILAVTLKAVLLFYAALRGSESFSGCSVRSLTIPLAIVLCFNSLFVSRNIGEHFQEGLALVPVYIHLPMQILFPLGMLVALRRKQRGRLPDE